VNCTYLTSEEVGKPTKCKSGFVYKKGSHNIIRHSILRGSDDILTNPAFLAIELRSKMIEPEICGFSPAYDQVRIADRFQHNKWYLSCLHENIYINQSFIKLLIGKFPQQKSFIEDGRISILLFATGPLSLRKRKQLI